MKINNRKDWILKIKISDESLKLLKEHTDTLIKNLNTEDLKQKSTRGFLSKQYNLKSSDLNPLNKHILPLLKNNFENYDFLNVSAWAVYGEEYGYHKIHRHNGPDVKDICTVTYLMVPEPNFNFSGDVFFVLRDFDNELESIVLTPEEGDVFIFPSHLLHGTTPQPKGTRQTLNLDFTPFLKKQ